MPLTDVAATKGTSVADRNPAVRLFRLGALLFAFGLVASAVTETGAVAGIPLLGASGLLLAVAAVATTVGRPRPA